MKAKLSLQNQNSSDPHLPIYIPLVGKLSIQLPIAHMCLSDQKLCNGCLQHCHIENFV